MENITVVPWYSNSEWQLVRQDIYADRDTRNYNRALRQLLLWKVKRGPLSRGLLCTELILQVITKDAYFCDVDNVIDESDLVRLYSMAVMKFVNLTADVLGNGPQRSMYFRASRLELPSWLIDMRHTISHDQDLPTLESLRTAIEFTLEWLHTKYWNNDDNFKVVTTKLHVCVTDEFNDMLELYMLNRTKTTADKTERLNALKNKLSMHTFSYKECIKKIKEFLSNKVHSSHLVNAFVTRYLINAQECNISKDRISKTDKDVWSVILKLFTTSGLLTNVLQCLVTLNSRVAALWTIELCIVLSKNSKKVEIKHNDNDICMNCKTLDFDSNLVMKTALNSPHTHTTVFLKWLLLIQSNPLKVKQHENIVKLVTLYTDSIGVIPRKTKKSFTVNDLISKNNFQPQSQWSLALDETNWKQIPFGTIL